MKYKCLVFDHDDTVVDSTRNIHYPSFVEFMKIYRPEINISLEEYINLNFDPGVLVLFQEICGLSEEEMKLEQDFWIDYTKHHISKAFDGLKELMEKHVKQGGILAVVSHSFSDHIEIEYRANNLPLPEMIFGWEQPKDERKPSPVPLYKIMKEFNLEPKDLLVIDDLKPGLDMANSAGVDFAAAAWCFDIEANQKFMKENATYYFDEVAKLKEFLEY